MKIRTDFVTNSSSSSFVLTLRFELTNGEEIQWQGVSDCGDYGLDYIGLSARKSPEEMGQSKSIEELIVMVKENIGEGLKAWGEVDPVFSDKSELIKSLRELSSMDEISKITIEVYEETFSDDEGVPNAQDEIVTYDMKTKKQTGVQYGEVRCECNGGALDFEYESKHMETTDGYFEEKRESDVWGDDWDEDWDDEYDEDEYDEDEEDDEDWDDEEDEDDDDWDDEEDEEDE